MKKVKSLKDLQQLMETLGAKKESGDGWASWTIDAGPGRLTHTDLSKLQAPSSKLQAPSATKKTQLKDINILERNNMKNTIELLKKQRDVLVEVIQYLDSTKQSNTLIRSQVDTILNFEKELKKDSEMELTKISLK